MDQNDYELVQDSSRRRIMNVSMDLRRFLEKKIDWRDRLISILGSRGTGKTTLLLQHIREAFKDDPDTALYVSMDNLWFKVHSLSDLVDRHYKNGGTHVFIDEIHYLDDWQFVIKNLYDEYPGLNIVYTGSSLLRINSENGDLSRRQIFYSLPGLSFREYLYFEGITEYEPVSLSKLLKDHVRVATECTKDIKVLKYFSDYHMPISA